MISITLLILGIVAIPSVMSVPTRLIKVVYRAEKSEFVVEEGADENLFRAVPLATAVADFDDTNNTFKVIPETIQFTKTGSVQGHFQLPSTDPSADLLKILAVKPAVMLVHTDPFTPGDTEPEFDIKTLVLQNDPVPENTPDEERTAILRGSKKLWLTVAPFLEGVTDSVPSPLSGSSSGSSSGKLKRRHPKFLKVLRERSQLFGLTPQCPLPTPPATSTLACLHFKYDYLFMAYDLVIDHC